LKQVSTAGSTDQNDQPDSPYLSIVIPVYNESDRIADSLLTLSRWVQAQRFPVEVIVVDDGSEDATVAQAQRHVARYPFVRVLDRPHRGKANAVLEGLADARGSIVGFMDVDLATPLDTWTQCRAAFDSGADVAIASREGQGSSRIGEPAYRHAMGRVFNAIVRLLLLPGVHDTQCGFKFFTRTAVDAILPRCRLYSDSVVVTRPRVTAFDVELLYISRKLGFRIAVIPVSWTYGQHTKVNPVTDTLQNARDVLMVRWYGWRGHYSRSY
jgi:glycosyltransferase involved in cell wall biosynthesis